MGKKRIVKKDGGSVGDAGLKARALAKAPKRKLDKAVLHVEATYNNTKLTLTDETGNTIMWSSAGTIGFAGARKSTPFAAAKVGELIGERTAALGVKEVQAIIKGVGAGRESSLRGFSSKGVVISRITDITPVPHNGPRPPKPRRI